MTTTAHRDRGHPIHLPVQEFGNRATIVFVTVCSRGRRDILARPQVASQIIAAWQRAAAWQVGRFVIMPDHVHLFCSPIAGVSLERWMGYWKSIVSQRWPGPRAGPIWQRHFWDRQLRTGDSYEAKWDYVRMNPVRAGLVESADEWPFAGELNVLRWE